jgi:transcriptional regulator with XRE-family HTH domain
MTGEVGTIHYGSNIKRIREKKRIKQEAFGSMLTKATGEEWSQQRVSLMEGRADIDLNLLNTVAEILEVTPEAIKEYDEEVAIQIFCNNFSDHATNNANYKCTVNEVQGILKMAEEIKQLYEALLHEKEERIRLYEQFYGTKKS